MTPTPLPPEWLIRLSRSKGKIYYYHPPSNTTQWSRPTAQQVATAAASNQLSAQEETKEEEDEQCDRVTKRLKVKQSSAVNHMKEDVLDTLIVASMRVGGSSVTRGTKRVVVFTPWPHQLKAVKKVLTAIQEQTIDDMNASQWTARFLLQHSTGAGKTVTIAALTHQLLYVKDFQSLQFHTIVVMLDRIKLNEQVGDAVETYLRRNGVDEVFRAESIEHLAKLLDATMPQSLQKVIITTTHKMGLLVQNEVLVTKLLHRSATKLDSNKGDQSAKFQRVAIITDEAHRSHTLSTREAIEKVVKAGEGTRAHLTFIGLTATPNTDALELFGTRAKNGFYHPFDCYPIAQATADGRIMEILADYTCITCELETSVFPQHVHDFFRKHEGAYRQILDHASDALAVLKAKALKMMTDFQVMKQEHAKVKCMIVVRSRQDVVRYYMLITTFVAKRKLNWNCYAAFSGSVALDGDNGETKTVTESTLNNRSVSLAISDVVIVCDKLDTGYNEPLLACMYIDRYLRSHAHTVQLLSRLNRRHRNKPRVRVLDFANHAAQVRRSFAEFWHQAKVSNAVDRVDVTAERRDLVTAIVVLCDHLPELCCAAKDIDDLSTFVSERVVPMERDAFQQLVDALRGAVFAAKRLEQAGDGDYFESVAPFRYQLLSELKKETEKHLAIVSSVKEDMKQFLDEIQAKMAARVQKYSSSFSGALCPQSLLDRVKEDTNVSTTISSLLQFGELERFEALLMLLVARNKQQSIESSIVAQVVKAAPASAELDHSRISAHIAALQKELIDLFPRHKVVDKTLLS